MRQQGIGTEIIRCAVERAKERGLKHVTGFATVDTLRKTFERNGFTVVKKVNYEKAFGAAHYNGKLASPCCYFMVKALV